MPEIVVAQSREIGAPPAALHAILADYRVAHPSILPKRAFLSLVVEKGGTGAGTVFVVRMKSLGATRDLRCEVTEPEPGSRLVETDVVTGLRTDFELDPLDGGTRTRVTFKTRWTSSGLRGWLERLLAPGFLKKLYAEELDNLANLAERERTVAPA